MVKISWSTVQEGCEANHHYNCRNQKRFQQNNGQKVEYNNVANDLMRVVRVH